MILARTVKLDLTLGEYLQMDSHLWWRVATARNAWDAGVKDARDEKHRSDQIAAEQPAAKPKRSRKKPIR